MGHIETAVGMFHAAEVLGDPVSQSLLPGFALQGSDRF